MKSTEGSANAFIVRIWPEPREIENAAVEWRGVIEHVGSGKRRYFRDLQGIILFMLPYLEQIGIKLPLSWRVREWRQARKLFHRSDSKS